MNIIPKFISHNFSPTRFGDHVRLILLHTEDGYEAGTASWFNNPAAQVSAHYGVGMDGQVDQFVAEGDTAWHAGVWSVNTGSVGIEHEDLHNPGNVAHSDAQYASSARLVADLCRRYGLACDRTTVKKHNEVSNSHPNCPGDLDVDHIVALAQALLGAKQQATVVAANSVEGVTAVDETVTVTVDTLNVRQGPGTQFAGRAANTKDGQVHDGDLVHVVGYVAGQDVGGNNIWLKTLNGLGESHWVWAGGTNFTVPTSSVTAPAPTPVPDPVPTPVAPNPPQVAQPEPLPTSTPEPTPEPVAEVVAPVLPELKEALGSATLAADGYVVNLDTNQVVAKVPGGTVVPVVGTRFVNGTLYLVSKNMRDLDLHEGIPSTYFVRRMVDSMGEQPQPVTLAQVPKNWHPILKFLHLLDNLKGKLKWH